MNSQTEQPNTPQDAQAEIMNGLRFIFSELEELKAEIAELKASPTAAAQAAAASPHGKIVFNAETLTATVDDGKCYWKVKGGQYQKFGVIIWPEVLEEAGINPDDLNPLQPVDLSHFVAVCTAKENGQPKKVIRLEPRQ